MANHVSIYTIRDYSKELSNVRIYNGAITAVSLPGFLTDFGGMRTAIAGITQGVMAQEQWIGDLTVLSAALPALETAQREFKWLVRYHGLTLGKKYTLEIPTANPIGRLTPGTDLMNLTEANALAFKTAFEAFARTKDSDTEGVVIDEIVLVGRNL